MIPCRLRPLLPFYPQMTQMSWITMAAVAEPLLFSTLLGRSVPALGPRWPYDGRVSTGSVEDDALFDLDERWHAIGLAAYDDARQARGGAPCDAGEDVSVGSWRRRSP